MLTNKENKAPCWRKPDEVTEPGYYNVADLESVGYSQGKPMACVYVGKEADDMLWSGGRKVSDLNKVFRLYGPIPQCEE